MRERNKYGRFALGNKGGPGRPRKRVECETLRMIAIEPPNDADSLTWLDYIRGGKWFAVECGGDLLEVRKNDALRLTWIQFRIVIEGSGRKVIEILGERVERDIEVDGEWQNARAGNEA